VRPVDRVSPSAEVSEIRRVADLRRQRRAELLEKQHHEH
jgi:hypothetical protein